MRMRRTFLGVEYTLLDAVLLTFIAVLTVIVMLALVSANRRAVQAEINSVCRSVQINSDVLEGLLDAATRSQLNAKDYSGELREAVEEASENAAATRRQADILLTRARLHCRVAS